MEKNKQYLYVFFSEVPINTFSNKEMLAASTLSKERQEKISKFYHDVDKRLSLCGEMYIRYLMEKMYCIKGEDIIIQKNNYGKPYLKECNDIFFNISHTRNAIVVAVSSNEVGIDIEKLVAPPYDIIDSVFSKKEKEIIEKEDVNKTSFFYSIWTRKESYLKWLGTGINEQLNLIDTMSIDSCFFKMQNVQGYMVTVCSELENDFAVIDLNYEEILKKYILNKVERM